ncbi:MAG: SDR family oxidoreductase [Deltaproteobacteria bacterium]|nr:SDR family oxidoreductase [Deltaproteobacteria bacterium]
MHVLITGASSGIGEALAREFAAHGSDLSLAARRREILENLKNELEGKHKIKVHLVQVDLSDPTQAEGTLADAERALGPVDVLINNAGQQVVERIERTDVEKAEATVRLNLLTPLRLWRAVLPQMLARKSGTIVDVASMAGLAPTPFMAWYNAGKAGLGGASEALRGELRNTGVHVVTVYPGPVDTPLARAAVAKYGEKSMASQAPMGTTGVLARMIWKAVQRRRARVIYPRFYALSRHFPNLTRFLLDRLTPAPSK